MNPATDELTIDSFMALFDRHFYRSEGRDLARGYVTGLTLHNPRKSVEPLSAAINASDRSLQRLLVDVKWDENAVLCEYRRIMSNSSASHGGLLVIGEWVFPKKGSDSVCVARQRVGSLNRKENCQIAIGTTWVGEGLAWPCFLELFVPPPWDNTEDPECQARRKKTRLPEEVRHREKSAMALQQLAQAVAEGITHHGVFVADIECGSSQELQAALIADHKPFTAIVHPRTRVLLHPPKARHLSQDAPNPSSREQNPISLEEIARHISPGAWGRGEVGMAEKDDVFLVTNTVALEVWPEPFRNQVMPEESLWLIIERVASGEHAPSHRYLLSNIPPENTTLDCLRLKRAEEILLDTRNRLHELGLTHFEGRSWPGWHRHVALVFLAFSYTTLSRKAQVARLRRQHWATWLQQRFMLGAEHFL